jgi:hypothetical protein
VNIIGRWNEATDRVLKDTVAKLRGAGHYEIIVNLASATGLPVPERRWLEGMESLATSIRARCGRLDIVGTVEQVHEILRRQAQSCLRWATSEEEAVCQLKGIPRATHSEVVTAQLDTD